MLALEAAQLDGPHFSCLYSDGIFYDLDNCKHPSYPDTEGTPDSLWGWTEAPPALYETFNPTSSTFSHPQAVAACYGPSTYSPAGGLDLVPNLEALGPGLPVYPTEDFACQTLGPPAAAYAPYPSPVQSEEEDFVLNSPALEVSDSESSDEALLTGSADGRGPDEPARSCACTSSCWGY
ncbi:PREDICTED: transcription factor Spi-B isoform X2 [Chrysochloris asiatica]|uniref:Transcription factor Spi-B isoform X2 n=1 Tax=Chrysochloris asiatica TaxID=185453 RepID=A0A9B0TPT4_CHRAS|nr:PREDICTED: transcription factor Spi-B isoform X2 [Chrysochloris asiatica]